MLRNDSNVYCTRRQITPCNFLIAVPFFMDVKNSYSMHLIHFSRGLTCVGVEISET